MLKLATLFHLNLMYSSIGAARRAEVIARCYHRVLDLAESGVPVAVEASGLTLEMIAALDPQWLERLRLLLRDGRAEYVASGYSQVIGPLAPAMVNARNLDLGRRTAQRLLGVEPALWLVNEMAWSGGLAALYRNAGARAVIMEWNNAWHAHPEWDARLRWHWQRAEGPDDADVPVVWVDTFDFQKLQRLCAGDITRDDFLAHWRGRLPAADETAPRHALLYGSDAEVFDFRPGRYRDEHGEAEGGPRGEWDTVAQAAAWLAAEPRMMLAPLATALDEPPSAQCGLRLRLGTVAQPVPVKKQEKYNLNRWAVTGRGDLELNTACHARARELADAGTDDDDAWRDLLFLWSSDLRTHLAAERWQEVAPRARLPRIDWPSPAPDAGRHAPADGDLVLAGEAARLELNPRRGLAARSVVFPRWDPRPVLGTLAHGYFDDITLGADFYTGHAVVQRPGCPKQADLRPVTAQVADGARCAGCEVIDGDLQVRKEWRVDPVAPVMTWRGELQLPARRAAEIHVAHATVVPGVFDPTSLGFAVRNGGHAREVFRFRDGPVHHGEAYSTLITAKGGLGATDGEVVIGDDRRRLVLRHDPTVSALVPTVRFVPGRDGRYFLRVRWSAQEIDETFVAGPAPWHVAWVISVTAEDRGLTDD
ncbi:MAG: glycoside hydrolase family 57 [bacterium]|nr:glycoside hydrolase family 57 [bacterium]